MKQDSKYTLAVLFAVSLCGSAATAWGGIVIVNPGTVVVGQQPAHLVSSTPAADSTVSAPREIRLEFSHALSTLPGSYSLRVIDQYGFPAADGKPWVSGETLMVHLRPDLAPGQYRVRYSYTIYSPKVYQSGAVAVPQRMNSMFEFTVK